MTRTLALTIATPLERLVDGAQVLSVRAEDASGGFGILPRHADLLTVLDASVVRWKTQEGETRFCAIDSGVLTVSGGTTVAVACREGRIGDDLETLKAEVLAMRAERADAEKRHRVDAMRLHTRAVRTLMHLMRGTDSGPAMPGEVEGESNDTSA